MKKKVSLIFVLLFCFSLLYSTSLTTGFGLDVTMTIYGNVTSEAGGGIVGAIVELWKDGSLVKTDYTEDNPNTPSIVEGFYSITYTGPRIALYYLKVFATGHFSQERFIVFRAGSSEQNFVLEIDYPAQTTVAGRVRDTQSPANGLQNARVYLSMDNEILQKTVSDNDGYFAFSPVTHTELVTFTVEAYKCGVRQVKTVSSSVTCTKYAFFYLNAGTSYAVLVGISQYENGWQNDISGAERSTNEWYDYLKNDMYYDEIYVYGDHISDYTYYTDRATESNIKDKLKDIRNEVGPEDIVVIYFATHGSNAPSLTCWDDGNSISEYEFKNILPKNSKTFVFLSSCQSASWINPLSSTSSNEDLFIVTVTSYYDLTMGASWDIFFRLILTQMEGTDYYLFNGVKYYFHKGNDVSMELAYKDTYRYWDFKGNVAAELGWMWDIDNGAINNGDIVDDSNPFYL
ncbi:MAG: hypothetical protein GPJ51_13680 [Candidatus Heimdallarchaeota archaeon]|nr:hypothetical protein [Candidatus Heimdallarchaeota archaeon]